ncbi:SigE family RNA polymerase sigma factor [Jatrophihabitans sp. DSM 45814]
MDVSEGDPSDDPDGLPEFVDFVAARQRGLLRFAMVLTGDRELSEDICADVLVRVFERWERLRSTDHLNAYVQRMIVNDFISWRRRMRLARSYSQRQGPISVVEDHAASYASRQEMIGRLASLPRRQRAAIVLRFYAGLSDDEIATTLSCRPSTARSHISRGLERLRLDPSTGADPSTNKRNRPKEA